MSCPRLDIIGEKLINGLAQIARNFLFSLVIRPNPSIDDFAEFGRIYP
jgi:hypothetical protein